MSKQSARQTSKQGQTANKQSNTNSSKQTSPANKQAVNASAKQGSSTNKQTSNVPAKQNRPADKPLTRQAIKQERRQEERQRRLVEQRRATRRKRYLVVGLIAAVVLIAGVSVFAYVNAHKPAGQTQATPTEQVFNSAYPPIDGVYCDQLEQTAYHIHAHLTIYINGQPVSIPQGVGIATDQSCFYWLHTHDSQGIIHIEAPRTTNLTLANFLNIWGQSFPQLGYHNELASPAGWTIYVNGQQVHGDFKSVVLNPHELITIAYNSPGVKPDTTFNWPQG